MDNLARYVLDNAETEPVRVREELVNLHARGETVADVLQFVRELEARKIKVPNPGWQVFDVCGTGGSGKSRINLSTVLAMKLSQKFCIAKHGNKAASGRVGSFDLIEQAGFEIGDTPEKVLTQLTNKNLSFVFAPAFHPALKALAPIRQSLSHPTIFNYLGPLLNPVPLQAQMIGVSSIEVGEKLAEVCIALNKNACLVHDTAFGLDDVSIGGATRFWMTGLQEKQIHSGVFFPEEYGCTTIQDFNEIVGGDVSKNMKISEALLTGAATPAQQDFLTINQRVAVEFFKTISAMSILQKILEQKQKEVSPLASTLKNARPTKSKRDFKKAITKTGHLPTLIAEIKKLRRLGGQFFQRQTPCTLPKFMSKMGRPPCRC